MIFTKLELTIILMISNTSEDWVNALTIVAFLSLLPLGIAIFFVILNRKNSNRHIQEREKLEQLIENQLLKSRIEIQEHTLTEMSREIHDNIGQVLGLVKLNLYSASLKVDNAELIETHDLLGMALSDLRNLNKTFNPKFLHQEGLMKAIAHEIEILRKLDRFEINFIQEGELEFIKGEKEVILFRMIQESIQNVIKHAQASYIEIIAKGNKNSAMFSISDNGKGFLPDGKNISGFGLVNLEERAKLLKASLEIFSYPSQGTKVIIHINSENE